jgi:hypothetical protein
VALICRLYTRIEQPYLSGALQNSMSRFSGLILIVLGAGAVLVGLLIYSGALSWFGRLPGDIRYESNSVRVYVPVVSMLIVSIVLSLLFYLLRRFF